MCVWAEVTSRSPLCLVWKPLNGRTAAGKTPLDLAETQNHYGLFVMEGQRRREEDREKRELWFCLRRTLEVWGSLTGRSCRRRAVTRGRVCWRFSRI